MRLAMIPLLAALAFTGMQHAWAIGPKKDSPYDRRIKSVTYNPIDTVEVNCVIGLALTITVAPGERYVTHAFGDQAAWALSQNGNHIFVQPTQANSDTNLVLVTDRHVYHLLLHFIGSKKANDGSAGNTADSFIKTPWAMRSATIALNYNYPDDDRRVALAKTNAQRVKDALSTASDQGLVNMSYDRSYDPAMNDIAPVNAWDNYRFTSFKFLPNAELPTITYISASGKETVPNVHIEGPNHNIIVAELVVREWRIRSGNKVIGVRNQNFNPALGANPGGTVSPYVRRALKQDNGDNQ
ncbi:type IV secretion system protein VirB9 [Burkholderia sp. WP9]|uniref:TrbG/VirB9 family P-type conjugative transfer protein n=1 Tax=Burkholderia sp. WP9 TaxID=1500263 RepID=UPI0008991670|nr:TrbG/VirB9 family P-type conjugative transfer protein [Burkholderia sp. WP9]SEF11246.1 type IV secretion system protein VirB9 [Burkholderia sp. WP9]